MDLIEVITWKGVLQLIEMDLVHNNSIQPGKAVYNYSIMATYLDPHPLFVEGALWKCKTEASCWTALFENATKKQLAQQFL